MDRFILGFSKRTSWKSFEYYFECLLFIIRFVKSELKRKYFKDSECMNVFEQNDKIKLMF